MRTVVWVGLVCMGLQSWGSNLVVCDDKEKGKTVQREREKLIESFQKIKEVNETIKTLNSDIQEALTDKSTAALSGVFKNMLMLGQEEDGEDYLKCLSKGMSISLNSFFEAYLKEDNTIDKNKLFESDFVYGFIAKNASLVIRMLMKQELSPQALNILSNLGIYTLTYFFDHLKVYYELYDAKLRSDSILTEEEHKKLLARNLSPIYEHFFNDFFKEVKTGCNVNSLFFDKQYTFEEKEVKPGIKKYNFTLNVLEDMHENKTLNSLASVMKNPFDLENSLGLKASLLPLVPLIESGDTILEKSLELIHKWDNQLPVIALIKNRAQETVTDLSLLSLARTFQSTFMPFYSVVMPDHKDKTYHNHAIKLASVEDMEPFKFINTYHTHTLAAIRYFCNDEKMNMGLSLYSTNFHDAAHVRAIATNFLIDFEILEEQVNKYGRNFEKFLNVTLATPSENFKLFKDELTNIYDTLDFKTNPILFSERLDEIYTVLSSYIEGEQSDTVKDGLSLLGVFKHNFQFLEASLDALYVGKEASKQHEAAFEKGEDFTLEKSEEEKVWELMAFHPFMKNPLDLNKDVANTPWVKRSKFEIHAKMNSSLKQLISTLVKVIILEKLKG